MWTDHSLLIHSSVDAHVPASTLAIVNNAAVNMGCKYLSENQFSILWGVYLGMEGPGRVVILCLIL